MNLDTDSVIYWLVVWLLMAALFVLGGLGGALAFRRWRDKRTARE